MISVVIPAFDVGSTLGELLGALAEQGLSDSFEVLVADNGSSDSTPSVVKLWADRLPVRLVDASARRGPAAARNIGAVEARGELIVFTDADDVVMPGWIEAWSAQPPGARFATGPIKTFETGAPVPSAPPRTMREAPVHLGFLPYAFGSNFAICRDLFLASGGFPEDRRTAEDVTLSWRLQLSGVPLTFVPAAGVAVRRREGELELMRQRFAYGLTDPVLVREFRPYGLRIAPYSEVARSYFGLIARLPLLFNRRQREFWSAQLGRRAGRLVGSVSARTFCP